LVAFVLVQVRVDDCPLSIVVGFADNVTVGAVGAGGGGGGGGGAIGAFFLQPPASIRISKHRTIEAWLMHFRLFIVLLL
jgi:hypothetical protein